MFAYNANVACDINNYILDFNLESGNKHDSVIFPPLFDRLNKRYQSIENYVLDAGYKVPSVMRMIFENGQTAYTPYRRPMTKKGFFKKYEFTYDEYHGDVICPANEILKYSRTDEEGYRLYKSDSLKCSKCESRFKCTNSKNNTKVYTEHIWNKYIEQSEEVRHTVGARELYSKRSQTIERVFADAKEKHGMRYAKVRGKTRLKNELYLLFACMNMKKMALYTW